MHADSGALSALYEDHRMLVEALGKLDHALALLRSAEDQEERRALTRVFAELGEVFRRDLEQHLTREERHLFPVLERHIGREGGPVGVMLLEHEELRRLTDAYGEALRAWEEAGGGAGVPERAAAVRLAAAAGDLSALLSEHAHKEDMVLFPLALRFCTEEELRGVAGALSGDGSRGG